MKKLLKMMAYFITIAVLPCLIPPSVAWGIPRGGGGEVLRISDGDDRMGVKIKTQKNT